MLQCVRFGSWKPPGCSCVASMAGRGQSPKRTGCNATANLIGMGMATNSAAEHLHFLGGLIARPKNVGAIAPSSPALARATARQIDPAVPGPVLELGPGTGVVTEALIERGIAPERITAI